MDNKRTYTYYKNIFEGQPLPLAFVDLDLLDENIRAVLQRAGNKNIRVATKSIRCRFVLDRILASDPRFCGFMSYTIAETVWLAREGYDDILVGYPGYSENDIAELARLVKQGKRLRLMIDGPEQAALINRVGERENTVLPVCIDVDMSTDFPGIHFGVLRSPVHTLDHIKKLTEKIASFKHIKIDGIMGYEAQVAGMGDAVKGAGLKNNLIRLLKKRSTKDYSQRRGEIVQWLSSNGYPLSIVNAGGTGSLELSATEPWVTEVTAGSAFYAPALFDHYAGFKHLPAAGFALQIVRIPKNEYFTCLGGGYIASGETGMLKQPVPYLPEGVQPSKHEGFGEVQTPVHYTGKEALKIGEPVFFRHSKAGELCEHFNYISVVKEGKVVEKTMTYRGEGKAFL